MQRVKIPRLHLHYSMRRQLMDEFMMRQTPLLPVGSDVLDLGGVKAGKRGCFEIYDYDLRITKLNISFKAEPDIQADGAHLPLPPDSFDAVVCTDVLEHVPEPRLLIQESCRVLRRGGRIIITVPFLYRVHGEPHDYGRYTHNYWLRVLRQEGFDSIQIERHGLFFAVLLDTLKLSLSRLGMRSRKGSIVAWLLFFLLVVPFQPLLLRLEQSARVRRSSFLTSFLTGYGIIAQKA